MTTDEVKFALLCVEEPDREKTPNLRESWNKLKNTLLGLSQTNKEIRLLGSSAVLLTMPSSLPILSLFVADAQRFGLQYTVQLFGQPILSYPQS